MKEIESERALKGSEISLSSLVERAKSGSASAENCLAEYFFSHAIADSKRKLFGKLPVEDQEDLAISAVKSFCLGIREGDIQYQGDKQLFGLLRKIIDVKIRKIWQYHLAEKRDIRRLESFDVHSVAQHSSTLIPSVPTNIHLGPDERDRVEQILEELQVELRGIFTVLLSELPEHPRRLLLAMLESDETNEELSQRLGRSIASIERYRQLIRQKLETSNR